MKTFVGLRGLFLLFSMIWTCAEDWSAVQVQCTNFWFYARIKPTIFHNLYMNPNEAFLGDDCPVTDVWRDVYYEFFYHPHDCGIVTKTLQETLLFKTKIKYISRNSSARAEMPLLCVVRNQYPLLNEVKRRDNKTGSAAKWEIKIKALVANEDAEVAFAVRS
ncbi:hypothetical protein HPG69_018988, partial [Diceros bicornis minor]